VNKKQVPVVAITFGDCAGIGPEIAVKAVLEPKAHARCTPVFIGDRGVVDDRSRMLGVKIHVHEVETPGRYRRETGVMNLVHVPGIDLPSLALGQNQAQCGRAMLAYVDKGLELVRAGAVDALIGGPHSKKAVDLAGIPFQGYPPYLALKTGAAETFLMLVAGRVRVMNVTLHVSLRQACDLVRKELVLSGLRLLNKAVRRFGVARPRIAVAGLNPHAGEEGMFGNEEQDEIIPAIAAAKAEGIEASGPYAGDALFYRCAESNRFDAFVGMYHDQAHIPIKTLALEQGCGLLLGVPFLFATVGHGCAMDIAGKGVASATSLVETIDLVSALAAHDLKQPA